jgi:hypothetical protein
MGSLKKLNKADITRVSYAANKQWNVPYTSAPNDEYSVYFEGVNEPFNITGSTTTNNQYKSLIFSSINHLFYQSYSGSVLNTGSLMFNTTTYESASQQRPTASYFDYNISPYFIDTFPTGSGTEIRVLSVNQNIYGSKILPNSFEISSSAINIKDDGYGNLYNVAGYEDDYIDLGYITIDYFNDPTPNAGPVLIGNIFYAHGIVVITNPSSSYQNALTGSFTLSFQNEHIIQENEVRCIVRESDFNLSYNPTLVTGSYESGSLRDFATASFFQPYVTTIGLYNDNNDLLMVAKLAKPIVLSSDTDMTFIVKYDT